MGTATPAANGANRRHSAALSEIRALFLNAAQRSVNRKVQGSNPWSGAKSVEPNLNSKGRLARHFLPATESVLNQL
jgi:hypothetical protein